MGPIYSPKWMAAPARLKNVCTEEEKCHNLMRRLNFHFLTLIVCMVCSGIGKDSIEFPKLVLSP